MKTWVSVGVVGVLVFAQLRPAHACGCLAIPSVASPVLQAGERILFAKDKDQVVAYIQIKYQGSADHFGWLLPLPSLPTLQLGTDELFDQLGKHTQPDYQLTTNQMFCGGGSASSTSDLSGGGCGGADEASFAPAYDGGMANSDLADQHMNEMVTSGGIGPYDYAVLHADDQTEMLQWLQDNKFFVPDGTGQAVTPYIHPGAFFLALKLRSGQSAGDVVPVIVRYTSDLPMIPIILTQVGAVPNMGILVWLLGEARAIPRNYYHTVIDELPVWLGSESYESLVVRAIKEAPKRHSFITEYAGPSSIMQNVLDYPGRFGTLADLKLLTDPSSYLSYLQGHGYPFDATLVEILNRYLPEPASLVQEGVSLQAYYAAYDSWQAQLPPDSDGGAPPPPFDPVACSNEIDTRIVQPTRATAALFNAHPYLTRVFTALSPEDMNADPVFSENPDLPQVPLVHSATVTIPCSGPQWLSAQGFESQFPGNSVTTLPGSVHIETLRESGPPMIVTDNTATIVAALGTVSHGSSFYGNGNNNSGSSGGFGCSCDVPRRTRGELGSLLMVALTALALRWPRRKKT